MSVMVRLAEQRDRETLGQLGAMLMRTHHAFDPQRFLAPGESVERGYASFLSSILSDEDARVFVAEDGCRVVGYAYVAIEPMSWKELRGPASFIHDIAVAENARRSGAATLMLEAAVEWLRERRAPRVILWSAAPNDAAQRLFRQRGFRPTMVEMTMEL